LDDLNFRKYETLDNMKSLENKKLWMIWNFWWYETLDDWYEILGDMKLSKILNFGKYETLDNMTLWRIWNLEIMTFGKYETLGNMKLW
jgi:hypothetical protein